METYRGEYATVELADGGVYVVTDGDGSQFFADKQTARNHWDRYTLDSTELARLSGDSSALENEIWWHTVAMDVIIGLQKID